MVAVALLVVQGFLINRLAGIPYPAWRPTPTERTPRRFWRHHHRSPTGEGGARTANTSTIWVLWHERTASRREKVVRMDRLVSGGPWFRRQPALAALVIFLLFAAVTVLRMTVGDERDATTMLYALPVSLAGMSFGRRGGTIAAVVATGLLWAWVVADPDVTLSALGWASRLVPMVLLGVLVGAAADAVEEATDARLALAVADARRRDAAEVNDAIIQRLTVAKWRLEAGAIHAAAELVGEAMGEAQALVAELLEGHDLDDRLQVRQPQTATRTQR